MDTVTSTFDGAHVTYDDRGTGSPTLLFVHGLAGEGSDFAAQVERFGGAHRTVTVDLPRGGAPGATRTTWTMAAYGEDVAAVADRLDLDDLVLIGHSFGGDVSVEAAARLGDRVRGLVWVSSYRSLEHAMTAAQIAAWLAPFRTNFAAAAHELARRNFGPNADPALVERAAIRTAAADPEMAVQLLASKFGNQPTLLQRLTTLDAPIVAINPDFKSNDAASLAEHGVDLMVVPDAGHYTMLEAPAAFNTRLAEAIEAFTRRT